MITPQETSKKWIANGWAQVGEKVQLNTLKQGEFFLKNDMICFVNVASKPFISFYNIIMQEHCTSDTEQLVHKIKLVGENIKEALK